MRDKEDIVVFYRDQPTYNPQFTVGTPYKDRSGKGQSKNYGADKRVGNDNDGRRYPKQVIEFGVVERGTVHPTQKPVELMEYMIRTYTNEGDTVLDNTMGSGTTGVACQNTGRNFIGIERDPEYFKIAQRRMGLVSDLTADIRPTVELVGVFA
jgi:site-specific DNA-methyltransferase (adenine-specific)